MKKQKTKSELLYLAKEKRKVETQAKTETFSAYMMMSLYILNKEFGIGESRASRYIDEFYNLNTEIENGSISFDEIREHIYNRLGMKIE